MLKFLAAVVFCVFFASCSRNDNAGNARSIQVEDPFIAKYLVQSGVRPGGLGAAIVYLDRTNGTVIRECGNTKCGIENAIRVMVRKGHVHSRSEHGSLSKDIGNFTRFTALDGSVSSLGYFKYQPAADVVVWTEQQSGSSDWSGHYLADVQLTPGYFLQYLYLASTLNDHQRSYAFARTWVDSAK